VTVIKSVEVVPLKIPFVRPFKISRGYVGAPGQPGDHVYVKLVTSDGEVGWGEARPMPSWMYETVESVCTSVERYLAKVLVGEDPFNINKVHAEMERVLAPAVTTSMPFAKSAVDIALHDLVGKLTGAPLHALLGGKLRDSVEMAALVSGEPGAVAEYAKELRAKGYRCFKLKIMGDPELDGELVRELKEAVPRRACGLTRTKPIRTSSSACSCGRSRASKGLSAWSSRCLRTTSSACAGSRERALYRWRSTSPSSRTTI
jgi:muconate cycloisomerase